MSHLVAEKQVLEGSVLIPIDFTHQGPDFPKLVKVLTIEVNGVNVHIFYNPC